MHAVVRHYSGQGAHQLFGEIEAQLNGVEEAIRSWRSYLYVTSD